MEHRMGSAAANSWKRLKVAGKMRRQEREAMGRDVLSGSGFIGIAGDSMTIRFPRKKCDFLFQQPVQSGRGVEEPKGGEIKRF
jgi:ribosomal protein L24E